MRRRLVRFAFLVVPTLALASACSSSSTSPGGSDGGSNDGSTSSDSQTGSDTGGDTPDASIQDSATGKDSQSGQDSSQDSAFVCPGPTSVEWAGCVDPDAGVDGGAFVDMGATDAVISVSGDAYGGSFDIPCLRIQAGHKVTWSGDFVTHPLAPAPCNPSTGGSIPAVSSGTTTNTTFTAPGIYGYKCAVHGNAPGPTSMRGVIVVY